MHPSPFTVSVKYINRKPSIIIIVYRDLCSLRVNYHDQVPTVLGLYTNIFVCVCVCPNLSYNEC
jgi:hypothetical protein